MRAVLTMLACAVTLLAGSACGESTAGPNPAKTTHAVFQCIEKNGREAKVSFDGDAVVALQVEGSDNQEMLQMAAMGDRLSIEVDDIASPKSIKSVLSVTREWRRLLVLLHMCGAALVLLLFALLITQGHPGKLIVGGDNRYSKSKFQMVAWFFALFIVYLATITMCGTSGWGAYLGKVSIPENLVILSGLSALTYGAAKAITVSKIEGAKFNSSSFLAQQSDSAAPNPQASAAEKVAADKVIDLKVKGAEQPRIQDLVRDDEDCIDLGDSQ